MENRVGDNVPSDQDLAQQFVGVQNLLVFLRLFCIKHTPEEARAALRPRKGSEIHIERVYDLALQYGLKIPNMPLSSMKNDVDLRSKLRSFADALTLAAELTTSTINQAQSEGWEAFLGYYGLLASMAERHAELATELRPVVEFMALGPRAKKSDEPETP